MEKERRRSEEEAKRCW